MDNNNQVFKMEDSNMNFLTILFGGFLALLNHFFGWMNALLDIEISSMLMNYFQAIVTGSLGALSAHFMNKVIKHFEKKKKKDV